MQRLDRWIAFLGLILISAASLSAQTRVRRYDVTKETDYGIVYRLPQTEIEVVLTVRELIYTPGVLSSYADRYLNKKASETPAHTYELLSSELHTIGRPDSAHQYLVVFDKKTIAPFVKLTDTGILYSINGGEELPKSLSTARPATQLLSQKSSDTALPALAREYAQAGSKAKQAEIAAGYLYDLRENLMNIVTGSVDNMPKDGESMRLALDQLRTEERRTQRLFLGDTTERVTQYVLHYTPSGQELKDYILARFSPVAGLTSEDDLSGAPIRLSLRILEHAPELSDKEQKKKDKMLENSIVYIQPGEALVSISYEGKTLSEGKLRLAQLGAPQALAPKMLNLNPSSTTSIYFDIRSGAVLDIRQE